MSPHYWPTEGASRHSPTPIYLLSWFFVINCTISIFFIKSQKALYKCVPTMPFSGLQRGLHTPSGPAGVPPLRPRAAWLPALRPRLLYSKVSLQFAFREGKHAHKIECFSKQLVSFLMYTPVLKYFFELRLSTRILSIFFLPKTDCLQASWGPNAEGVNTILSYTLFNSLTLLTSHSLLLIARFRVFFPRGFAAIICTKNVTQAVNPPSERMIVYF